MKLSQSGHIVLIEDEKQIRHFVKQALERESFTVYESETFQQGLIATAAEHPDLVILNLRLPTGGGIEFIKAVRHWSNVPILILLSRTIEYEKKDALEAGADDFLTKPFGIGELHARVRTLLRHRSTPIDENCPVVAFGHNEIDLSSRLVHHNGDVVHLTAVEYLLLSYFIAHSGKVLTQRALLNDIWGPNYVERGHYLRVYVGRLRQKLEDDPGQPKNFLTETGVGYRFVP